MRPHCEAWRLLLVYGKKDQLPCWQHGNLAYHMQPHLCHHLQWSLLTSGLGILAHSPEWMPLNLYIPMLSSRDMDAAASKDTWEESNGNEALWASHSCQLKTQQEGYRLLNPIHQNAQPAALSQWKRGMKCWPSGDVYVQAFAGTEWHRTHWCLVYLRHGSECMLKIIHTSQGSQYFLDVLAAFNCLHK